MSRAKSNVYIAGYARTPIGHFLGQLSSLSASDLGAIAIQQCLEQAHLNPAIVEEVLMGCVLTAGQGQAPARQSALKAGLTESVNSCTINKMCGSGMKSVMIACDMIQSGSADIVIAGGMESMSNAPYLALEARRGHAIGHQQLHDHLFLDGLEDFREKRLMGCYAEDCAKKFSFSREQQDDYARQSLQRARKATESGFFNTEICPVNIDENLISRDQHPDEVNLDKLARLKPVFKSDGTVTAGNASSISDGAAALLLVSEQQLKNLHIEPLGKIIAQQSFAQDPSWFTTAPAHAVRKLLNRTRIDLSDIDLYEINEAFAVVALANMQLLNLSSQQVNIHGGACALGHPIGASGARILVTLLSALKRYKLKRGIAAICIGGGEATAMAIES